MSGHVHLDFIFLTKQTTILKLTIWRKMKLFVNILLQHCNVKVWVKLNIKMHFWPAFKLLMFPHIFYFMFLLTSIYNFYWQTFWNIIILNANVNSPNCNILTTTCITMVPGILTLTRINRFIAEQLCECNISGNYSTILSVPHYF